MYCSCVKTTTYYFLNSNCLYDVATDYPTLARKLVRARGKSETAKVRSNIPLDYKSGKAVFKDASHVEHYGEVKDRAIKSLFALKNSVVNLIMKNRRNTKLHSLKEIFLEFVKHNK